MLGILRLHNGQEKRKQRVKQRRSYPETDVPGAVAVNRKSDSARHTKAVKVVL
jgi:hypothetical protein